MDAHVKKPVCVVLGVGPGNGAALARRFAAAGYDVACVARGAEALKAICADDPQLHPYACDAGNTDQLNTALDRIAAELGAADVVIYNAGKGVWGKFDAVSLEDFEAAWRTNCLGLMVTARHVAPAMKAAGRGQIVVIGATASRRGVAATAAFASAKMAQKALTESLARTLWPDGIHISLIIIDGVVDGTEMRATFADRPDDYFVKSQAIADLAFDLTRQDKSAWSFEIEARPFGETW